MRPTLVSLEFACRTCGTPVGVTVKCEGIGLAAPNPVVATIVPCPGCGGFNQLLFSPDGTLHRVTRPQAGGRRLPAPCNN
jgi:hypothetical protein